VSLRPAFRLHVHPRLRLLGHVLFPNWLAITLGSHIWSWRALGPAELAHESKHAEQWGRLGWRYPLVYWLSSLRAVRKGGDWYRDNEFEREARAAADAAAHEVWAAANAAAHEARAAADAAAGGTRD
jgi:hypothetical protein